MSAPFLIAVVGGSASGKTTLARALCARLGDGARLVAEDDYYHCSSQVPDFDPSAFNFDTPEAKDHALLAAHLAAARAGEGFERPVYSMKTHRRTDQTVRVEPGRAVVAEGLHLLWRSELAGLFDLKVFVDTPADVRLARRVARDVRERDRDTIEVLGQYLANVRPMHEAFVAPQARRADLVVDGEADPAAWVQAVLARLPEGMAE